MQDAWAEKLSCATHCHRCNLKMAPDNPRILSVINHEAICMSCKDQEEKQADYEQMSKQMIGQCLIDTEMKWGDPEGYCYHHFYPFTC